MADLTDDNRWHPPEASEEAKNNKIALLDSINNSLSETRRALDLNYSTSSQGGFVLGKSDFGVLDRIPPIDSALVWNGKSYSGSVSLDFEVIDVNQKALDEGSVDDILATLRRWGDKYEFYKEQGEKGKEMDESLARQGQQLSKSMRRSIEEVDIKKIFVASILENGKKKVLGLTTVKTDTTLAIDEEDPDFVVITRESGKAYIDTTIAYPESQVYRDKRPKGQIGSVGRAVRDFAIRKLRESGRFSAIYDFSANNKTSTALKKYGFKPLSANQENSEASCI
ncbi:MAG: hypothetical protein ACR2PT_18155 [Endozoicomonas sp.]